MVLVEQIAGKARLHRLALQRVLEPALGALAGQRWSVAWLAVRRRLNMAADRTATWALRMAARLGLHSHGDTQIFTGRDEGGVPPWLRS